LKHPMQTPRGSNMTKSSARKAAAKKARGTHRKSVAQTRELYEQSLEAVLESWESFVVAAGQGAVALNRKAIHIARRNINTGFGLAESLAGAKSLPEAMELQATYWRKQLGELASQAGEMRTLSTKVATDVTAPIKAQVTRSMR
jgi:hypothetical protein